VNTASARARNQELQVELFGLEALRRLLSQLGPYLVIEIVLPGGTLLALLLYLYRRNASLRSATR
jgi:hypothetical protein